MIVEELTKSLKSFRCCFDFLRSFRGRKGPDLFCSLFVRKEGLSYWSVLVDAYIMKSSAEYCYLFVCRLLLGSHWRSLEFVPWRVELPSNEIRDPSP